MFVAECFEESGGDGEFDDGHCPCCGDEHECVDGCIYVHFVDPRGADDAGTPPGELSDMGVAASFPSGEGESDGEEGEQVDGEDDA